MANDIRTVFITGASSGIGKAAVVYFNRKGWNVAATMRNPENETELDKLSGVKLFRLDVLDTPSINRTIEEAIRFFGRIDVLVNNAGYAAIGPFEAASEDQIRRQLNTNITGLMMVTKAIIPHFKGQGKGAIINISSAGGRITFPYFSMYHTTKWAVEGFSESLWYEMKPLGIKVKIIEPGAIQTDFYTRSPDLMIRDDMKNDYPSAEWFTVKMKQYARYGASPDMVARRIYRGATSKSHRLRYTGGGGAGFMISFSKLLPFRWIAELYLRILR